MAPLRFNLVSNDDQQNITIVVDGEMHVADSTHAQFNEIVRRSLAGDASVVDLFHLGNAVSRRFEPLGRRVTHSDGELFFDGDRIEGVLVDQILRFIEEDEDVEPLVAFLENVMTNAEPHVRDNLFRWLAATKGFSITPEGLLVGYKGVRRNDDGFVSINSGYAVVDGEEVNGRVPNNPGSYVTIPRSQVEFNPAVGCSTGLHVGTWEYAEGFGDYVLKVIVNPQDVVSVPTDSGDQKMRCCAYYVVDEVDTPDPALVVTVPLPEPEAVPEPPDLLDPEEDEEEEEWWR